MAAPIYSYYTNTFKGSLIPAESFDQFALRAVEEVDYYTFSRASTAITDDDDAALVANINLAYCAVAEALYSMDVTASGAPGAVASERVGDYSVNYVANSEASMPKGTRIVNAMRRYLAYSGLLYQGWE